MKCDETHPHCKRCIKYGTECEGYLPGRRRPPSSSYGTIATSARALVPKNQQQLSPRQLFIQPVVNLFESEQDGRYFSLFSDRIATEICPYFNPESWTRLILQACIQEPSIRHAAVAIGALGRTYQIAQLAGRSGTQKFIANPVPAPSPGSSALVRTERSKSPEEIVSEAGTHHRHALEQYDKAIKRMRNDIESGNQNMRTTLIICIIIICFEAIHGNHESAAGQLQSGLGLIQNWKAQQRTAENHPQGFSSPAPEVIEDYLVQVFGRMEIQSMSVFDPRPPEVHKKLKHEGKEIVAAMPSEFDSIEQARIYLDLITRRLMHFNASIHVPRTSDPSRDTPPPMPGSEGKAPRPMPWIDGKIPLENTQSTLSSSSITSEKLELESELFRWQEAFRPLLILSSSVGGQEAISALTMNISSTTSMISLRAAFFINESAYDAFLPEFTRVVEQASLLLGIQKVIDARRKDSQLASLSRGNSPTATSPTPSLPPQQSSPQAAASAMYPSPPRQNSTSSKSPSTPSPRKSSPVKDPLSNQGRGGTGPMLHFAFDIGVVPALYLVAVKCRNRPLRHRALALLQAHPRREGVWDSVATLALGRWVVGLEEEGTKKFYEGTPPPTSPPRQSSYQSPDGHSQGSRSMSLDTADSPGLSDAGSSHKKGRERGTSEEYEIEIPEEVRVRKAKMRFDLLERRANMDCMQMDFDKRKFVVKSIIYTW